MAVLNRALGRPNTSLLRDNSAACLELSSTPEPVTASGY
jgi:hypothetical protein